MMEADLPTEKSPMMKKKYIALESPPEEAEESEDSMVELDEDDDDSENSSDS